MSARTAQNVTQAVSKASKVRHASVKSGRPKQSELGREIFVYNHLQTNQVIYSLTRGVNNNRALKQLPYNGKKTVPASLRKDLWSPLACITFPTDSPSAPQYGLKVLHKLREYRKLHETQWPESFALDDRGQPLSRKLRGRKLCDQKANSVADMAAALRTVTLRDKVPEGDTGIEVVGKDGKRKVEKETLVTATVRWRDILDAEFAESWPETVVHDTWIVGRNNRKLPLAEAAAEEETISEPHEERNLEGAEQEPRAKVAA